MARLPKPRLLAKVERAIIEGGWRYLRLPSPGGHPARYSVFRDERRVVVRTYIWNLTPGGKNRPLDEWRIQATGVTEFQREPSGKTLILGWDDVRGVFVGFDLRKHQGTIGHSPSIQLREAALDNAAADGFAIHNKGNKELAVARGLHRPHRGDRRRRRWERRERLTISATVCGERGVVAATARAGRNGANSSLAPAPPLRAPVPGCRAVAG